MISVFISSGLLHFIHAVFGMSRIFIATAQARLLL